MALKPERLHSRLSIVAEVTSDLESIVGALDLREAEVLQSLADGFLSGSLYPETTRKLLHLPQVTFAQAKATYEPHVNHAASLVGIREIPDVLHPRSSPEDGTGVFVGIVDSGFDLSHPAFRTIDGRLKVAALLDQTTGREYSEEELARNSLNAGPGNDLSGHGTHVAAIAAGSRHQSIEGVAPGARFLLVKTDFLNTDEAVAWIFRKASGNPCVINLSLGGHDGAHDGSGEDERLHTRIIGPGRIVVVAAGNDRQRRVHFGHDFYTGERHDIKFDIFRPLEGFPAITVVAWSAAEEKFRLKLISPDGTPFEVPASGQMGPQHHDLAEVYLAGSVDQANGLRGTRVEIVFRGQPENSSLIGWRLLIECGQAFSGRLDGWITLSRQGMFQADSIIESSRTVCVPATGPGCLAVGSFTSNCKWKCDVPPFEREDKQAVQNRFSRFTSLGPTRDGRWKPDVSAPGEHISSALALRSDFSALSDRAQPSLGVVTLAGTSMAAPIVTGIVAMMLQLKPSLATDEARKLLIETARRDKFTGPESWSPAYGYGKVDARSVLARLR